MIMGGILFPILVKPWQYTLVLNPGNLLGLFGIIIVGTVFAYSLFLKGIAIVDFICCVHSYPDAGYLLPNGFSWNVTDYRCCASHLTKRFNSITQTITIILKNMAIVICRVFLFSILTMISDVFIIYIASSLNVR